MDWVIAAVLFGFIIAVLVQLKRVERRRQKSD